MLLYQSLAFTIDGKKNKKQTGNPSIRICLNNIENRITFRIKTGYLSRIFNA